MLRLARLIRRHHFLQTYGLNTTSNYEKQIYKKNTNWHPPPAPSIIEDKLTEFEKALKRKHEALKDKYNKRNLSNLTPLQTKVLAQLRQNNNIVIKPSDKNLGPVAMDTTAYIRQALEEHLLTKDYRQLSKEEAFDKMEQLKATLKAALQDNKHNLSEPELTYFKRSLTNRFRLPIFYGLPKVHKNPFSLQPVVSTTNSLLAVFSTWLDYKMKELLPFVKSYIKNSIAVIQDLKCLTIPDNALLFSADAVSMYTNIETQQALTSMQDFIQSNIHNIQESFPTSLFLQVLEIVMKNNIFSFGDTFWIQQIGTAMGTPTACSYASITYGQHENTQILPKFKSHLLYYKRYIDDVFGIWLPSATNNHETWEQFKAMLNNWAGLRWKIQEPSQKTVFLDLNIQLSNATIVTSTFQKSLNLYLYIPPLSAHPPSCLKGLIAGEMRRYWLQNNPEAFRDIVTMFLERLINRGNSLESLTPILHQVVSSLDNGNVDLIKRTQDSDNTLYIHRIYHPNGLQRNDIRQLYDTILKPYLNFEKMTVAISRPTNLRDILTSARLKAPPALNLNNLITDIKQKQPQDT
jgi:hypothetical protein